MFIRKTRKIDRQTQREYFCYQLVESYRTEKGPRQRILLNLGVDLDLSENDRKVLADRIEEITRGIQTIFPASEQVEGLARFYAKRLIKMRGETYVEADTTKKPEETASDYRTVDINSLVHEQGRTVGAEHIALETIKKLQIDKTLLSLGMRPKQVEIVVALIIGRLVAPGSDRATHEWLQNVSGIDELLETTFQQTSLDSVYKAADDLFEHKDAIEAHLSKMENDLFSFEDTILLYDLTNTYFEGGSVANPKAQRGRSKEKRSDCPLMTLGLVLNQYGFPKRSDIFPGNASEPGTLREVLGRLKTENSKTVPIIVFDAGMATEENLAWLRQENYRYIVSSRKRCHEIPCGLHFDIVRSGERPVEAAQAQDLYTGEIFVYCRSEARKGKEQGMLSSLQERFEKDLQHVLKGLTLPRGTKKYSRVLERVGRLKERHKRISGYYEIEVVGDALGEVVTGIRWRVKESALLNRSQGAYVLRTFGLAWTCAELWKTYTMLTEVEESFRCMKSELGMRPIFHQTEKRTDAHLFVTLLAYHVMRTVLHELSVQGIQIRWETLCRGMSSQVRVTTSMRLKSGQQLHVRSSTLPDAFQRRIYQILNLPQRPGGKTKTII